MADPIITWELSVDLDGDHDFETAGENIIDDATNVRWTLGDRSIGQLIAPPETLTFELDNSAGNSAGLQGLYSPEHANALAGFRKGAAVRIRSTHLATTREMIHMWIDDIKPLPDQFGDQKARVVCEGFFDRAKRARVFIPTQVDKRADEIIEELLNNTHIFPPGLAGVWLVGTVGLSEIGETTFLSAGAIDYLTADTGISIFPFAMENLSKKSNLYAALRLVAESERGDIFVGRDGKVFFWSRHHLAADMVNAVDATLDNTMVDIKYAYGTRVANEITLQHIPRTLDATIQTLATFRSSIKVPANQSTTLTVQFDDGSGNQISTTSGITPVAVTDFSANTQEDGSGVDGTAQISVTATFFAQSVELIFTNGSVNELFILANDVETGQVRGNNKLTSFGQQTVVVKDAPSIAEHGLLPRSIDARLLEDADTARNIAAWELTSWKDPRGQIESLSIEPLESDANATLALATTMGDRFALVEEAAGVDAEYFVVGEEHQLKNGGHGDYSHKWIMQPASQQNFWLLNIPDFSEIGETTTLAA